MPKPRILQKTGERFGAAISLPKDKSLPPEIREDDPRAKRQIRVEELRRQYLSGEYYVPAIEISSSLIEKHLKR